MKKLSLALLILCTACAVKLPQKPYLCIGKDMYKTEARTYTIHTDVCYFTFVSKDGYTMFIDDSCKFYRLGDTIK
jgi:hypothetical protein